jgi:hypothetical protein
MLRARNWLVAQQYITSEKVGRRTEHSVTDKELCEEAFEGQAT